MKFVPALVIILLTSVLTDISYASIYKWVDEKGKVHFGDRPSSQGAGKIISQEKTPKANKKTMNKPAIHPGNMRSTIDIEKCERAKSKLQEYIEATVTAEEATITVEDVKADPSKFNDMQWVRDNKSIKSFETIIGIYCEGRSPAPRKHNVFAQSLPVNNSLNRDSKEPTQLNSTSSEIINSEEETNADRCERYKNTLQEYDKDSEVIADGPRAGEVVQIIWNKSSDVHIQATKELIAKYCTK